ncbi:uncharacterized protein LOC110857184 [Folsomia candida]|uniref:Gamma-glutamylcyclotransferase AIG2-like domain-containing protein n=1 Tax=Folsomia candida TaxID=158441 RepID=A0A226DKB0_FOLCA|nr:uncharacterized protein LOC110857184 [Folsomia candida]OXA45041.1 hypothetical protein Fcan01_19865 [Folsomia candida]
MCKPKHPKITKGSSSHSLNKTLVSRKKCPPIEPTTNFILGYGSLINPDSKEVTHPGCGPSVPVLVKGFKRIFNCAGLLLGKKTTFLGVEEDNASYFTGVAFPVKSNATLMEFDQREAHYKRKLVAEENVKFLDDEDHISDGKNLLRFWIYVPQSKFVTKPSKPHPIYQSYFDIFVDGCVKIGKQFEIRNFAQECLQSTEGWLDPFFGGKNCWEFDRDEGIDKLKIVHDTKEIDEEIMFFVETYMLFIGHRKEDEIEYILEK